MSFDFSPKVEQLRQRLLQFMDEHVYPNESTFPGSVAQLEPIAGSRRRSLRS